MCVLRRERDELREELERERMRLAACGVVADANTPESAKKWRNMRDEYRSASCDGVARAVDREMRLRRALQKIGNDWCVPPMIADEALTAIEDVRENAEAECVQIVDGIVRPVPWDNWRNCANQLLESLKYIHSICEDKTIELPDDDYAKVTIDECIMEAERAMQKCKKMEGEANVPLEESEGLHEDIIFWLTRAENWRCMSASLLVYAESLLARIPDTSEINWTVLEQARAMFREGEAK
jgi:hypothetical protein